jgi:hypothetical protein
MKEGRYAASGHSLLSSHFSKTANLNDLLSFAIQSKKESKKDNKK